MNSHNIHTLIVSLLIAAATAILCPISAQEYSNIEVNTEGIQRGQQEFRKEWTEYLSKYAEGIALYHENKYSEAVLAFEAATKLLPPYFRFDMVDNSSAHIWTSYMYYKLGKDGKAREILKHQGCLDIDEIEYVIRDFSFFEPVDYRLTFERQDPFWEYIPGSEEERLKKIEEQFGKNHYYYSICLANVADRQKDRSKVQGILEKCHNTLFTCSQGTPTRFLQEINDKLDSNRKYLHFDSLFDCGVKKYEAGQYAKAAEDLILCSDKNNYDSRFVCRLASIWLAHCYMALGEKNTAYATSTFYDFPLYDKQLMLEIDSLKENAEGLQNSRTYDKAFSAWQDILTKQQQLFGEKNPWCGVTLWNIGYMREQESKRNEALPYYESALKILTEALPIENIWVGKVCYCLIDTYTSLANTKRASEVSELYVKFNEEHFGLNSPQHLKAKIDVTIFYLYTGEGDKALNTCLDVYNTEKNIESNNGKASLNTLRTLAAIYNQLGNDTCSIKILEEALDSYGSSFNEDDKIDVCLQLAGAKASVGKYSEALELCKEIKSMLRYATQDDFKYHSLALIYDRCQDDKSAITILEDAIFRYNRQFVWEDETSPKLHVSEIYLYLARDLGRIFLNTGNLSKAKIYLDETLSLCADLMGTNNQNYANIKSLMAAYYIKVGEYDNAITIFEDNLKIARETNGESSPYYLATLHRLAKIYNQSGNYEKSDSLSNQALISSIAMQGKNGFITLQIYQERLIMLLQNRKYEEADKLFSEVNAIYPNELNANSPIFASIFRLWSVRLTNKKDYTHAEDYIRKALYIDGATSGISSSAYTKDLRILIDIQMHTNSVDEAIDNIVKVNEHYTQYINSRFLDLTTNERTILWNDYRDWFEIIIPQYAGIHPTSSKLAEIAFDAVLFSKGILLSTENNISSFVEDNGDAIAKKTYGELRDAKLNLKKLHETGDKNSEDAKGMEAKVKALENELSTQLKEYTSMNLSAIRWKEVQKNLGTEDAAVEFNHYNDGDSIRYCAYIITKESTTPQNVSLFSLASTEDIHYNELYSSCDFSKKIWGRLDTFIGKKKNVYFSPSGVLYTIAVESIPMYDGSDNYVSDKWHFYRLTSTRELASRKQRNRIKSVVLYGGIKYDVPEEATTIKKENNVTQDEYYSTLDAKELNMRGGINELPATYTEVMYLDSLFRKTDMTDTLFTKSEATEESFRSFSEKSKNLFHIATHGFYWNEKKAKQYDRLSFLRVGDEDSQSSEDYVLTRSGLLLSGAANTILGKSTKTGAEDGILTAGEIAQMNLAKTDLVVMSACQTGLGEVSGEGVFGLQRGFKKAGVNSMLVSLCKVDDGATNLLMKEFYNNLINKGLDKAEALKEAQKTLRNYQITKVIDIEGAMSAQDTRFIENYEGELPEPVNGKITITTKPYNNPLYWAMFVLIDALPNATIINDTQDFTKPSSESSVTESNNNSATFDRWSGNYQICCGGFESEGESVDITIKRLTGNKYTGTLFLSGGMYGENEFSYYGDIKGAITATVEDDIMTICIKQPQFTKGMTSNRYKKSLKEGDAILSIQYRGAGKFHGKPIGKLADIWKYTYIETTRKDTSTDTGE